MRERYKKKFEEDINYITIHKYYKKQIKLLVDMIVTDWREISPEDVCHELSRYFAKVNYNSDLN